MIVNIKIIPPFVLVHLFSSKLRDQKLGTARNNTQNVRHVCFLSARLAFWVQHSGFFASSASSPVVCSAESYLEPRVTPTSRSADGRWEQLSWEKNISYTFYIFLLANRTIEVRPDHAEKRKWYPEVVNQTGNTETTFFGFGWEIFGGPSFVSFWFS